MRRPFILIAFLTTLASMSCDSPTEPSGTWAGSMQVGSAVWSVSITLTQTGDSLTGSADITSSSYNNGYFVNGNIKGDSVTLRLRPVEDADINIAGTIDGQRIDADWWFNSNTSSKGHILLGKQ